MTQNLKTVDADQDYFSLQLFNGESIDVTALFSHADGDVDLQLASSDCGTQYDLSQSTSDNEDVHWTNNAGEAEVWVDLPPGWRTEHQLFTLPAPGAATSSEVRSIDFELRPTEDASPIAKLAGYALVYVCEGADGRCLYRRVDFELELASPGR